jgi:kumamolisin
MVSGLRELVGSARAEVPGARRLAPVSPEEVIDVSVFLRRRSHASRFPSLFELGARPLSQRSLLSRESFAALHGASVEDRDEVRSFAIANGLTVQAGNLSRRTVGLRGTVRSFGQAFGIRLDRYQLDRASFRGRSGVIRLPSRLHPAVQGVFGLDDRPQLRTHFRRRPRVPGAGISYTPLQIAQAYDFPSAFDGRGQCIGLLELGGGYRLTDVQQYFQEAGLAPPPVVAVGVDGAANSPTGNPDGPDGEVELDIELAGSLAPGAQIVVYFAPNTDRGFLDALTTAIHDTTNRPSVVSISWGSPEDTWTDQARAAFNSACEDAATLGVTVLASAGDQGASDGEPAGTRAVDFPASSPYALGCGGTRLTISAGVIQSEQVWNDLSTGGGATGGGVSAFFPRPAYQAHVAVPSTLSGFIGRGVPDVAADADPHTGFATLIDGAPSVVGGTSAVSPLWAALLARINQAVGRPVGYLTPLLYASATRAGFHDITIGDNGGYDAGPGWDACTGLGTPDGMKLLSALRGTT